MANFNSKEFNPPSLTGIAQGARAGYAKQMVSRATVDSQAFATNDTCDLLRYFNLNQGLPSGQHFIDVDNSAGTAAVSATVVVGLSGDFSVTDTGVSSNQDASGNSLQFMNPLIDGDYLATPPTVANAQDFFGTVQINVPAGQRVRYTLTQKFPVVQGWRAAPNVNFTVTAGSLPATTKLVVSINTVNFA